MRFLHTADWHLGRTLHGADLNPAFEAWCDHVVELCAHGDFDALFISGDVYDRAVPPVVMTELFDETLVRLREYVPVVVTSGNHDSAKRLGFGSKLMADGVYIRTDARTAHIPVELPGAYIYAIPYLDPIIESHRLSSDEVEVSRSHEGVVGEVMRRVEADAARHPDAVNIVLAHAFVVGAEHSDSERDISVGGVESVPSGIFRAGGLVDYVALGHVHRPQRVGRAGDPKMRYSGSPIAFSFSEEGQKKSSVVLDTQKDDVELVPTPVYRPLATLTDSLENLLSRKYDEVADHFLRVYVTDEVRPANLYPRLSKRFPNLLEHHHVVENRRAPNIKIKQLRTDPVASIEQFFKAAGGTELNETERKIVQDVWEKVRN